MPGTLVETSAKGTCTHGGQMTVAGTSGRVFLGLQPAAKATDIHPIVGCAFNVSGKPQPCVTGSQFTPAKRVFIEGVPALLNTSVGLGKSAEQAPQGPAAITVAQKRVFGT
jgi:hypothetical protein